MNSPSVTSGMTVGRLAALFLLLWWAGLNCVAACALKLMPDAAAGQHCQLNSDGEDCCAAESEGEADASGSWKALPPHTLDCCPLPDEQASLPGKAYSDGGQKSSPASGIPFPALQAEAQDPAPALPPKPLLLI
jgi:hypothetical protein